MKLFNFEELSFPGSVTQLVCSYLPSSSIYILYSKDRHVWEPREAYNLLEHLLEEFRSQNFTYLENFRCILCQIRFILQKLNAYFGDLFQHFLFATFHFPTSYGLEWISTTFPIFSRWNQPWLLKQLRQAGSQWLTCFRYYVPDPMQGLSRSGFLYCLRFKELSLFHEWFYRTPDSRGFYFLAKENIRTVALVLSVLTEEQRIQVHRHICQLSRFDPTKTEKLNISCQWWNFSPPSIWNHWQHASLMGTAGSNDYALMDRLTQGQWNFNIDEQADLIYEALSQNKLGMVRHLLNRLPLGETFSESQRLRGRWRAYLPRLCEWEDLLQLFLIKTGFQIEKDWHLCPAVRTKSPLAVKRIVAYLLKKPDDAEVHETLEYLLCREIPSSAEEWTWIRPLLKGRHVLPFLCKRWMNWARGRYIKHCCALTASLLPLEEQLYLLMQLPSLFKVNKESKVYYKQIVDLVPAPLPLSLWQMWESHASEFQVFLQHYAWKFNLKRRRFTTYNPNDQFSTKPSRLPSSSSSSSSSSP